MSSHQAFSSRKCVLDVWPSHLPYCDHPTNIRQGVCILWTSKLHSFLHSPLTSSLTPSAYQDVTRLLQWKSTCISEERITYIYSQAKQEISMKHTAKRYFPPKRRLTFTGLCGVISQSIKLFTATATQHSVHVGDQVPHPYKTTGKIIYFSMSVSQLNSSATRLKTGIRGTPLQNANETSVHKEMLRKFQSYLFTYINNTWSNYIYIVAYRLVDMRWLCKNDGFWVTAR
jgi:hypothetical protein